MANGGRCGVAASELKNQPLTRKSPVNVRNLTVVRLPACVQKDGTSASSACANILTSKDQRRCWKELTLPPFLAIGTKGSPAAHPSDDRNSILYSQPWNRSSPPASLAFFDVPKAARIHIYDKRLVLIFSSTPVHFVTPSPDYQSIRQIQHGSLPLLRHCALNDRLYY